MLILVKWYAHLADKKRHKPLKLKGLELYAQFEGLSR